LHHVVLERWSCGASAIHRRDPRAKLAALLVFLVAVATAHRALPWLALALFVMLAGVLRLARLPVMSALSRSALVLPFSLAFALVSWMAGDPGRGLTLILKSYLSALAVLIVVATTPLPLLLRGLEMMRTPRFLLIVAQFLYRYLFVISEEAQHMRKAAAARSASARAVFANGAGFRAAAGALAVLFAKSYSRAGQIHQAMLARGFTGSFQPLGALRFEWRDAVFVALAVLLPSLIRVALERAV
jgi:cobalt/nickel transport system permease protein